MVEFPDRLLKGTLIKRYKRFLVDIKLDTGKIVTAHCANTGSMLSVRSEGSPVWVSPATNPDRKLKYTWELVEVDGHLVGINTSHPNRIVSEAIKKDLIPELSGYSSLKRERKYGKNSRIDILLEQDGRVPCYVEVKNVTLKRNQEPNGPAEFPDAVTARGAKHLEELSQMVKGGSRSMMFYLVQRSDCPSFTIASDIDPNYAKALGLALSVGVEAACYSCNVSTTDITIQKPIPMDLPN